MPSALFWAQGAVGLCLALACNRTSEVDPTKAPGPSAPTLSTRSNELSSGPLRIAYSDWPGWVAWQVAIDKHYFEELGVKVNFVWAEYTPTIEAFSEGQVDAVCMTNGDALMAGSSGAPSVGILINDYSNGNDMLVARPGIERVADLRSKRIGVEVGVVDHLLLMEALGSAGMGEADVQIVNTKTQETPELLRSGKVDAIAAWQPHGGRALELTPGSKSIFTSANVPGLIYDLLFVSRSSLAGRRADWLKVVAAWFRVVDFISDPSHRSEALEIMARRVGLAPESYAKLMGGTRLLGRDENQHRFGAGTGFQSVSGSSQTVDRFNVQNHVYKAHVDVRPYFDRSLVDDVQRDSGTPRSPALQVGSGGAGHAG
jgi:NitT/TauT family transport system substrate-binding protein